MLLLRTILSTTILVISFVSDRSKPKQICAYNLRDSTYRPRPITALCFNLVLAGITLLNAFSKTYNGASLRHPHSMSSHPLPVFNLTASSVETMSLYSPISQPDQHISRTRLPSPDRPHSLELIISRVAAMPTVDSQRFAEPLSLASTYETVVPLSR